MRRNAFTMVEAIVVISIIVTLLALLLPGIQHMRASALRLQCQNNMRQIGIAIQLYHNDNNRLPPGGGKQIGSVYTPNDPNGMLSWMALVLPYIEEGATYSQAIRACRANSDPLSSAHDVPRNQVIRLYVCPNDSRISQPIQDSLMISAAFSSYLGVKSVIPKGSTRGYLGAFARSPGLSFASITDGLSNTIIVGERPPPDSYQAGWWYPEPMAYHDGFRGPNNVIMIGSGSVYGDEPCLVSGRAFAYGVTTNPCDRFRFWSLHQRGGNFLFADGAAKFISYDIGDRICSLLSINGAEPPVDLE